MCKYTSTPTPKGVQNKKPNASLNVQDYEKEFPKLETKAAEPKVQNLTQNFGNRNKYGAGRMEYRSAHGPVRGSVQNPSSYSRAAHSEYKLALGPDPKIGVSGSVQKPSSYSSAAQSEYKLALGPDPQPFNNYRKGAKSTLCSSKDSFSSKHERKHSTSLGANSLAIDNLDLTLPYNIPETNWNVKNFNVEPLNKKYPSYAAACGRNEPCVKVNPVVSILDNMVVNSSYQRRKSPSHEPSFLDRRNSEKLAEQKTFVQNLELEKEWRARCKLEKRNQKEKYEKEVKERTRLREIEQTCSYLNMKPNFQHEPSCKEKIQQVHRQKMKEEGWMDPDHFAPPKDYEDGEFMNIPKTPFQIYNGCPPTRREEFEVKAAKPNTKPATTDDCKNSTIPTFVDKVYSRLKKTFSTEKHSTNATLSGFSLEADDNPRVQPTNADTSPSHTPDNSINANQPSSFGNMSQCSSTTANTTSQYSAPIIIDTNTKNAQRQDLETSCYMSVIQAILENEKIIASFYTEDFCNSDNCSICIVSSEIKQQGSEKCVDAEPGYEVTQFCKQLYNRDRRANEFLCCVLERMEADKAKYHPKLARASATYGSYELNILCSNCSQVTVFNETVGPTCLIVSAESPGKVSDKVNTLSKAGDIVTHKCGKCYVEAVSQRKRQFTALPEVIFVVADRFFNEKHKSLSPVEPSLQITLSNKTGASFKYKLTSIISHQGSNVENGLYYTASIDVENDIDSHIFVYTNTNIEAETELTDDYETSIRSDCGFVHEEEVLADNLKETCRISTPGTNKLEREGNGCSGSNSTVDELSEQFSRLYQSPEIKRADNDTSLNITPPKASIVVKGDSAGIFNFGQSCFMSTVLQTIGNNETLRNYLCTYQKCGLSTCSVCILTDEISDLFKASKSHRPVRFWNFINDYKPEFTCGQHDSTEFMLDLFARVEMDKIFNHPQLSLNENPMSLVLESTVLCSGCQHESTTQERVDVINIPVGVNSTIQEQLSRYLEPEMNTDYTCGNCEELGLCSTIKRITKLPDLAIIMLQRYNNAAQKDSNPIFTNEEIEFTDGTGAKVHYNLSSAILHNGNYVTEGHYTCIILKENKVLFYNDDKKTSIKVNQIPRTSTYMLFYNRETSPPPQTKPVPVPPTPLPKTSTSSPPSRSKPVPVPPTPLPKTSTSSPPSRSKPVPVPPTPLPKSSTSSPPSRSKPVPVPPTPLPKISTSSSSSPPTRSKPVPVSPTPLPKTSTFSSSSPPSQTKPVPPNQIPKTSTSSSSSPPSQTKPVPPNQLPKTSTSSSSSPPSRSKPVPPNQLPKTSTSSSSSPPSRSKPVPVPPTQLPNTSCSSASSPPSQTKPVPSPAPTTTAVPQTNKQTPKSKKRPHEDSDSEVQSSEEESKSKPETKNLERAVTPYATKKLNFSAEDAEALLKKFVIKSNSDKVINLPPVHARGGDIYIYVRRCNGDMDYCRDGYHGFVNDGSKIRKSGVKVDHYKLLKPNTKQKDRQYVEGFKKNCYYIEKTGKIQGSIVLIHYVGDENLYRSRPHGLSKTTKPFVSNTKAVKDQIEQSLRSKLTPQRVLNKGITDMYQQFQSKSQAEKLEPVMAPRGAKQVYNINHQRKLKGRLSACEVFNLLELALQDYGSMIHDIVLYPDEGYVFGDPANIYLANHLLKKCGKDPALPQLLSYDTTFNLGDAYLSCLVMRNIYFEGDPLFPVMYLIHNRKAAESHRWLFNRFDKLTSFSKKYTGSIPIISDRETAIKNGIREILKSSAYVSCHNHLLSDIKVWLKKTNAKIDDINGLVKEIKCLLYSKTEEQFNSLYEKYSKKWDSTFHDYIETSVLEDIKTSTEFKYNKFAAFENVIPTNNLSESMNSKIKHFLSRNELPKDSLLLGLHQLQIEILRDFSRSYGSGRNFVPKKQFQNTSDSLQLPDYINLTQEEFMKLFQPARPQTGNPPQKLDHRVSQKALAKLAHAGKLVSFDISARCYNIRSPYKSNVNTVFFNEATHRLQCTCVSKSASKCYHIIAAELFDINKPDQEEKPRVYQLSALQKRFRKAIGRAGRKAPKPQDEDFVSLPAPTSIAAKRKPASQQSPLPKAAQLLKKAKQTNAQPSTPKSPATVPTLFTKLKQGIQSSKSKSSKERDQSASNSKDYTLCPYILDEFVDTLKPKKWIDGHVIDIALRLTVAKYNLANHVLILSHSINELAFQDAKNPALCCRLHEQQPLNYNIILAPMSVKPGVIGYHWLLGVLILNTKNILILDSLKVSNVERTADFKRLLKIAAACYISSGIDIDFQEFNCIFARDKSIQRNGWDCGLFVIKNAEAIISKTNINYECESEKERLRVRDFILQKHVSEESKVDPRDIYPKSTHRLLSERASFFIPKLDNITLEQRIRTQDVSTILAKDFTNSKLNWKKCSATNCKLDLNQSRHQEGCALCRRWVHYSCEDLHTDPQIHVDYLFCCNCLEKIRESGPPPGVRIQQISDGSNIGNPITVDDRDEDKKNDAKTSKSRQQDKASKPLGGQKDVDDLSEDPMDTEQDQASTASSSTVQFPHPSDGSDEEIETKPFTSKSVKQDKKLNPLGVRGVDNLHEDPMDDEQDKAKTNSPLRVQVSHITDASDDEMETKAHTSKTLKQEASGRHEGDGDVLDGDPRDFSQESDDVGSFGDPVENLLKVLTNLEGEIGTRCLLTQVSSDEELVETCNNLKSVAKELTNEANYAQVRNHWSRLLHNKFLMFTKSQLKCIRDQLNLQLGELWLELKDDEAASRQFWNRSGIYHYVFRIHVHASLSKVDFNVAYEDAIKSEQALDDLEEQDQGKKDEFDVDIQDFDCLRPFQDLSTEVVQLSFLALIEKTNLKDRFLVLPFEFWKWSLMSQHRKLGKYIHRYNPLSYEFILVPVNTKADPNQPRSQWSLGIILIRNRQIMLMDSFANTLESRELQFVALVKIALSCFLTCGIDVEHQFQAIYSQDCPKQRYSEDSGIFTIKNLAAILERTSPMFRVDDQDRCIIKSLLKTYKNLVPDKFYPRSKEAVFSQNIMSYLQSRLDKIQKISNQEIRETKQIFENYFENVSAAVCSKNCSLSTENLEKCTLCSKFYHSSCEVLNKPIRVSANYNFCYICFNDIETSMDKIKASMETYIEIGTAENKNFIYIVPPALKRRCQKSQAIPTGQLLTYFRAVKPELHNIVKNSQDMELQNTFKRFKKVINLNMMFNKNQMDWLNAIINAEVLDIIERDKDNSSAYAIAIPMLLLFMKVHVYANINKIDFKEGLKDLEQMHECRWIREDSDDDVIPGVDLE